jgi:hypothetical protein
MFANRIITLEKKPRIVEYYELQKRRLYGLQQQAQLSIIQSELVNLKFEKPRKSSTLSESYTQRDRALILRELLATLYKYPLPSWTEVKQLDGIDEAIELCESFLL